MRITLTEKKKSKPKKEVLVDEVTTQADCKREGGSNCGMYPRSQPKPAGLIELKEGVFGLSAEEIKKRNTDKLNGILKRIDIGSYGKLKDIIEGYTQEGFDGLMTRPDAVNYLLDLVRDR